jgi:hypothetical protein
VGVNKLVETLEGKRLLVNKLVETLEGKRLLVNPKLV